MANNELKFLALNANKEEVEKWAKTIQNTYSNTDLSLYKSDNSEIPKADLYIIDTNNISESKLEFYLDTLNEKPCLIIIDKISDFSKYNEIMHGRREAVLRADTASLTFLNAIHHLLERQKLHDKIQSLSHHLKETSLKDDLTNLYNHKHFNMLVAQEVKKANRYKRPLSVIVISLNNLNQIYENNSLATGDKLLITIAKIIQEAIREVDIASRYGNNEFTILLPETNEDAASRVANRLHLSIIKSSADLEPLLSFGIAGLMKTVKNTNALINGAMRALVEAKQGDNGTICTHSELIASKQEFKENKGILDEIKKRISIVSHEAKRSCFQSIMRILSENAFGRRHLLPHGERVAFFAEQLAQNESLSSGVVQALRRAGLIHDIGKLAIDQKLFLKEDKLSPAEYSLARQHATLGFEMLENSEMLTSEREAIRYHHERFDGNGYPDRLAGNNIPLEARILSIAEVWDTLTNPQPYRKQPLPLDEAIEVMKRESGHQFDPKLTEKFLTLISG